jgi:DNA-binding transcriptional ArsR family regulator
MTTKINRPSMVPILKEAIAQLVSVGASAIPNAVMTVIADHLRSALEGSQSVTLEQVERELDCFFREALSAAPKGARSAVQGSGDAEGSAAFLLGQAAFAHLLAARTLDTRVDQTFVNTAEDKRYQIYFRAMLGGPKDGVTLARLADETPESVSRKLATLRERGLVVARQEGKRVVNKLSPPAKAFFEQRGLEPLAEPDAVEAEIGQAIADLKKEAPESFRELPVMGGSKKKAA